MASAVDMPTLELMIRAMISGRVNVLTDREIKRTAQALALICSNYSVDEIARHVARYAVEHSDRRVEWKHWDS